MHDDIVFCLEALKMHAALILKNTCEIMLCCQVHSTYSLIITLCIKLCPNTVLEIKYASRLYGVAYILVNTSLISFSRQNTEILLPPFNQQAHLGRGHISISLLLRKKIFFFSKYVTQSRLLVGWLVGWLVSLWQIY